MSHTQMAVPELKVRTVLGMASMVWLSSARTRAEGRTDGRIDEDEDEDDGCWVIRDLDAL
jgi:hypothetical protein